jgi:chemotaxis protein methyltransferase CheR
MPEGCRQTFEDPTMASLRSLVTRRAGLRLEGREAEIFTSQVREHMSALGVDLPRYVELLQQPDRGEQAWQELLRRLTTPETYFFRDSGQFNLLRRQILPDLRERRASTLRLRIWCAGCSSGEEPYSLAILLKETAPLWRGFEVTLIGSDLCEASLEKARRGVYQDWSFRGVDPEVRARHFQQTPQGWEILADIRNSVRFVRHNLLDPQPPEGGPFDLILCRNVLIYMEPAAVAAISEAMARALEEGGYLLTGHGELHAHPPPGLAVCVLPGSVVYRKDPAPARLPEPPPPPRPRSAPPPPPLPPPRRPARRLDSGESVTKARQLLAEGDPGLALRHADAALAQCPHDIPTLLVAARACEALGQSLRAEAYVRRALAVDLGNVEAHYLLSRVARAQGKERTWMAELKQTLELDPRHPLACADMALALLARGRKAEALTMRGRALEILAGMDGSQPVEPASKRTVAQLIEALRNFGGSP